MITSPSFLPYSLNPHLGSLLPSLTGVSKPSENKAGGKRRRRRAGRGDKGGILLNSLEQEMLHWAQHGFLPAGPDGLTPTAGICIDSLIISWGVYIYISWQYSLIYMYSDYDKILISF